MLNLTKDNSNNFFLILSIVLTFFSILVTLISWFADFNNNPRKDFGGFVVEIIKHNPSPESQDPYTRFEGNAIKNANKAIIIFGLIVFFKVISDIIRNKKVQLLYILIFLIFIVVLFFSAFYIPSILSISMGTSLKVGSLFL